MTGIQQESIILVIVLVSKENHWKSEFETLEGATIMCVSIMDERYRVYQKD